MTIQLDVQFAVEDTDIPTELYFKTCAKSIPTTDVDVSVCLRIVGKDEARDLNNRYRNINKPTNVLSFSSDVSKELEINFLGDVVICAPLVCQEALIQEKNLDSHWAHLLVHGILHLQGYNHDNVKRAKEMEALEISTLKHLGIENPY